jgi:hypothetical protein
MALLRTRHRKILASITLGCWLFAFLVGIASACGLDDERMHSWAAVAATESQGHGDDAKVPGCEQFRATDLPALTKIQSAQDLPGGPTLAPAPFIEVLPAWASVTPKPMRWTHPPPDIALYTRFVRLAL